MSLAIGVDIGGTKIAGGVVDEDGSVIATARRDTPGSSPQETESVLCDVVAELRSSYPDVISVGIGAAGWIDAEGSIVLFAPNLAWRDEPLRDRVSEQLHLPVFVENDANAAAWAECRFGAGRGEDFVVVLTVGTGIGGGLVLGGQLYRGRWGLAGEPGHICVVADGEECGCGNRGCLERYASGSALTRFARERAAADATAGRALLELAGGDADAIEGEHVTRAAQAGDPLARSVFAEVGFHLGQAMADLAALLDPARFVIGGGVADAGELLVSPARDRFVEVLTGASHRPVADVRVAELGNSAGLVGAADLARLRQ